MNSILPGVIELMCYPRYADPLLGSSYISLCRAELAILCHPTVNARLKDRGIPLVMFAELAAWGGCDAL